MKNLITYDPSFNNQYFKDDHLELEELTKIITRFYKRINGSNIFNLNKKGEM